MPSATRPLNILVAPDSFKGSLDAVAAADCISRGITKALPDCSVTRLPIADGGEGSAEILMNAFGGDLRSIEVTDGNNQSRPIFYFTMTPAPNFAGLRHSSLWQVYQ